MFSWDMYTINSFRWEEEDKHFSLNIAVPGADKEEFDVNVYNDEELHMHFPGNEYMGEFAKRYTLPTGSKKSDVSAQYADGVLTIKVEKPSKEETKIKVD